MWKTSWDSSLTFPYRQLSLVYREGEELIQMWEVWDFPGGALIKNPPANAGDTGSSPGPGRSCMPQSN